LLQLESWWDALNQLRGLTCSRVLILVGGAFRLRRLGAHADQFDLLSFIDKSRLVVQAAVGRRRRCPLAVGPKAEPARQL